LECRCSEPNLLFAGKGPDTQAEVFAQVGPQGFRQGEKRLNDLRVELRAAAPADFLTRIEKRQRPAIRLVGNRQCDYGTDSLGKLAYYQLSGLA